MSKPFKTKSFDEAHRYAREISGETNTVNTQKEQTEQMTGKYRKPNKAGVKEDFYRKQRIYEDFRKTSEMQKEKLEEQKYYYRKRAQSPCDALLKLLDEAKTDLKSRGVIFEDNYPSNYNDVSHQDAYVLRYAYAYTFEYYNMYRYILKFLGKKNRIKVLSFGAGSLVDACGLDMAARDLRVSGVEYTGVEIANWERRVKTFANIKVNNIQERFRDFVNNREISEFDVIVFPKSLRDIVHSDDIFSVSEAFTNMKFDGSIILATSMVWRDDNSPFLNDEQTYLNFICDNIQKKGNFTLEKKRNKKRDAYICNICGDSFPKYPEDLWSETRSRTGRNPMMNTKYEGNTIVKITRKA